MSNFLKEMVKVSGNANASVVADGIVGGDCEFYDTGSYILNALISGSIYGGIPSNKITAFAGAESVGKTFIALSAVLHFQNQFPDAVVIYFESEGALTEGMLASRGIDINRIIIVPVATVEDFRTQAMKILDGYEKFDDTPRLMFVLDSMGNLSTNKEVSDISSGKDVMDMTRTRLLKGAFRVLTLKISSMNIPIIVTNHVYARIGSMDPTPELAGGCLTAGHEVLLGNNEYPFVMKKIEDCEIGDSVKTMFGDKKITDTFVYNEKEIYEIELNNGEIIKCTPEHKFLIETDNGYEWIETKNIKNGDILKDIDLE